VPFPTSRRKLRLLKTELKQFSGEIKDWLGFWNHDDMDMPEEDKFRYLIEATVKGSRAREIVDSFPPTAANCFNVIDSLKTGFGRKELLIEFYVRELLGLVVKNAKSRKRGLGTPQLRKLESYLRALESIGMTSDKYAATLCPLMESCTPAKIC